MFSEMVITFQNGDLITTEIDSETEQEESNEKEKEKSTSSFKVIVDNHNLGTNKRTLSQHQDPMWIPPCIDHHTPPPELS